MRFMLRIKIIKTKSAGARWFDKSLEIPDNDVTASLYLALIARSLIDGEAPIQKRFSFEFSDSFHRRIAIYFPFSLASEKIQFIFQSADNEVH